MRLLGPVFWHDLVGIARRQRVTLWRVLYIFTLLAVLLVLYIEKLPRANNVLTGGRVRPEDLTAFGVAFFATFVIVQFALVILITPALAANALAGERSGNRLEFLLTTSLTNREIVAGKLLTRLLQVAFIVLTGLPVLALTQLFGGVDPTLMLAAFAALGLVGLSLACVGLACGIRAKRPQTAAWRAYQIVLLYAALSVASIWYFQLPLGQGTAFALVGRPGRMWVAPSATFTPPSDPAWWQIALESFNAGNPYFAFRLIECESARGTAFLAALARAMRGFSIFHLTVALVAGGYAILRLRAVAAAHVAGIATTRNKYLKAVKHPPIRDRPMLWKEIYCESKPRQRWLAVFLSRWFFFISFLPAWILFLVALDRDYGVLAGYTMIFLRYGGTLVACILCLRVAMQAARSVASEHERSTLDNLLTTSLRPSEIIAGKWWGSLLSCRWMLLWLVVHWCLGVLTMVVEWYTVPVLVIVTLVFAAFSVSVGILSAAWCGTGKQALACTLLILIVGATLVPWMGGAIVGAVSGTAKLAGTTWQWQEPPWNEQLGRAFSPPSALAESIIQRYQYSDLWDREFMAFVPYLLVSLMMYSVATLALAMLAARIFHRRVRPRATRSRSSLPVRVALATG